jgi:hypothetical protein
MTEQRLPPKDDPELDPDVRNDPVPTHPDDPKPQPDPKEE